MSAPVRTCCRGPKAEHSFHCVVCGTGLAACPPRASTAAKLDRWFAGHGWDSTGGRPLCPACKVPTRPSVAGALELAECASGLRGRYETDVLGASVRVQWTSAQGYNPRIEDEALGAAVRALRAAGYEANRVPGMPWVLVADVAAALGADEPGIDHEHPVRSDEAFVERYEAELDMAAE